MLKTTEIFRICALQQAGGQGISSNRPRSSLRQQGANRRTNEFEKRSIPDGGRRDFGLFRPRRDNIPK